MDGAGGDFSGGCAGVALVGRGGVEAPGSRVSPPGAVSSVGSVRPFRSSRAARRFPEIFEAGKWRAHVLLPCLIARCLQRAIGDEPSAYGPVVLGHPAAVDGPGAAVRSDTAHALQRRRAGQGGDAGVAESREAVVRAGSQSVLWRSRRLIWAQPRGAAATTQASGASAVKRSAARSQDAADSGQSTMASTGRQPIGRARLRRTLPAAERDAVSRRARRPPWRYECRARSTGRAGRQVRHRSAARGRGGGRMRPPPPGKRGERYWEVGRCHGGGMSRGRAGLR